MKDDFTSPLSVPLIETTDVQVHYHIRRGLFGYSTIRAVDGVTLAIQPSETLAIVGESGSGKTSFGRATLKLQEVTRGQIVFDGLDITHLKETQLKQFRASAQAIFQDPYSSLNPYMTLQQLVDEPMLIQGVKSKVEREDRTLSMLEAVRLRPAEQFLHVFPHMLSGGQRQRVGIARALILHPRYVMADEPVSMIDASSRAELLYLIQELQKLFSITVLYITHDIASARHFSNDIAVMYLGSIVESGTSTEVVERPLHPYTKALIDAVPEPNPANRLIKRPVISGEPPSSSRHPQGCPFHPRCPQFMPGKCDQARPQLREIKPKHYAACFLYE